MNLSLLNFLLILYFANLCYSFAANAETQTIVFIGRSGSGISSTVRTILGNAEFRNGTSLIDPEKVLSLTEYTVFLNGSEILKIVDVPGLIDDNGEEEDDEILRNLRDYLSIITGEESPLFVTVSYFHDSRYEGENSLFVQLLEKVKTGQENLRPVPRNILHMNYLLAETKSKQRKPSQKLQSFVSVAERYAQLTYEGATVGDNSGEEEGLIKNEEGMTLLPNKEAYPLNLLKAILNATDDPSKENFQAFLAARNSSLENQRSSISFTKKNKFPKFKEYSERNISGENWSDTISTENYNQSNQKEIDTVTEMPVIETTTIVNTEVTETPEVTDEEVLNFSITNSSTDLEGNLQITSEKMEAFNLTCFQNPPELISRFCISLTNFPQTPEIAEISEFLSSKNVTKIPETLLGKTILFQEVFKFLKTENPLFQRVEKVTEIIKEAFHIEQMPYTGNLLPGLGYDILSSEETGLSPYLQVAMGNWTPTELGYKMPPYIIPTVLGNFSIVENKLLFQTKEESVLYKLGQFNNGNLSQISNISKNYEGSPLFGYNVMEDLVEQPSLTSGIEVRTSLLSFDKKRAELNPEFISDVKSLSAVNTRGKNSVKEWEGFFQRYGTHVVKGVFYGGTIQGNVFAQGFSTLGRGELADVLKSLAEFSPLTPLVQGSRTYYAAFGGERFPDVGTLPERNDTEREEILQRWRRTVSYLPVPLPYEMDVFPIFTAAKDVGKKYEGNVRKAWKLYINGNLKYEKKGREKVNTTTITFTREGNDVLSARPLPSVTPIRESHNHLATPTPTSLYNTRFSLPPLQTITPARRTGTDRETHHAVAIPPEVAEQMEVWKTWMNQSNGRHEFFKSVATNIVMSQQNMTLGMRQVKEQMESVLKEREDYYRRRKEEEIKKQERVEDERRIRWNEIIQQGDEEELRREQRYQEDLKRIKEENEIKRNFTLMMIEQAEARRREEEEENKSFFSKAKDFVGNLFG